MAKQQERTVKLDSNFVRHEAAEAVRTFLKPVVGTYHLVRDASNPDRTSAESVPPKVAQRR
jgi:hypothetical protein